MAATSPGYSGKYGSVTVAGTEIPAYDWDYTEEIDELDATTFMSRKGADTFAQQQMLGGIGRYNVTFNVRPTALVTSTAMSVGAVVTVKLMVNSGLTVMERKMRITDNGRSNDVKAMTEMAISCTSLTSEEV
jgi:hypothetical protein